MNQKSKWITFKFSSSDVVARGENSLKLKIPNGKYSGYSFWISNKLIKENSTVVLREDFTIKIQRVQKQNNQWIVTDEKELGAEYFSNVFYDDEQIRYCEIHPEKLEPIQNPQADAELMR